jgi:hypothetical protein
VCKSLLVIADCEQLQVLTAAMQKRKDRSSAVECETPAILRRTKTETDHRQRDEGDQTDCGAIPRGLGNVRTATSFGILCGARSR